VDRDLEAARVRLAGIDAKYPVAPLVERAQRLGESGDPGQGIDVLQTLAADMGADARNP
jgi:hypothetical protein